MTSGTVKWYSHLRGFGFIEPDDGAPDVFVTIQAIQRSGLGYVYEGQRVSYELMRSATEKHAVFNLQAAPALPRQPKPKFPKEHDLRAVLFVDQVDLQRSLGFQLGRLGFDVILPVTLDEARQALQPSLCAPDLLVMNFRNADGGTLDLLDVISQAEVKMSVVLIAEATDVSTAHHQVSMDGVVVLPTELDSFSSSVRRLCGLKMPGWSAAEHGNTIPASGTSASRRRDSLTADRLSARYEAREQEADDNDGHPHQIIAVVDQPVVDREFCPGSRS